MERVEQRQVSAQRGSIAKWHSVGQSRTEGHLRLPERAWIVFIQPVDQPKKIQSLLFAEHLHLK